MGKKLPARQEINKEYTWAMEDLYPNDAAWQKDYEELENKIALYEETKGHVGATASMLLKTLQMNDEIGMIQEKVYVYANQKLHEDTSNPVYQDMAGKASRITVQLVTASSYMIPELLAIPEERIQRFLDESEDLREYKQYLMNILREKEHTLSEQEEELLAAAGEVGQSASDIFDMFNNADLKFPDVADAQGNLHELTHGKFILFLQSNDRELRKDAFRKMHNSYRAFENTLAASYAANIKKEIFFAKTRKYGSTLEAALSDSNVPLSVYTNLIEAIHEHLPLMHRYVEIRKKKLGVEELHMYDLHVPIVSNEEKEIPFEQAKEMVLKGLKPLGSEYASLLEEGFNNRWIDVYENQGKRSGAYSWGAYGTHPYVLLNYQENLNNVFTLAHEMGHALHSWYSDDAQPYVYAGYKIFVAEVASTCNESLLIHDLISKSEQKQEKIYLINYFLEQFRNTVFRQTMFAEFEMITHGMSERGETLTAEVLCDIYYELNKKYFGEGITVDPEIAIEWARIPHFYRSFYVYQYATGFSAAVAISGKILKEGKPAVDAYKQFLQGGSSDYPIELLKIAGVDMTEKKAVSDALSIFGNYLDEFERLINEE